MHLSKIFKRVLLPCAVGVTRAENASSYESNCVKKTELGTKPSDLPIYSTHCSECPDTGVSTIPSSSMEETVGMIRRELWVWQDNLKGYRHKFVDVYRKGFSKADSVVNYLREESHSPQRMGAIGLSGLAGYVLGMRRSLVRRIFYSCCGALGMAAICYPNEAVDYLETIVLEARRYFIVIYHFIYGETPKMPGWFRKSTGDLGLVLIESDKTIMDENSAPEKMAENDEKKELKEETTKQKSAEIEAVTIAN